MKKIIRIGTRESQLALWQANLVQDKLQELGCNTQIVPIKSQGDIELNKPLHELGISGVFTKKIDIAMLNGDIDIAVHSMKDVPTTLPKGIINAAVLPRADVRDVLLYKGSIDFFKNEKSIAHIATGSLRRAAFWKNKFKNHTLSDLRGNVNTRLQKLQDNPWNGVIFAKAGLERIEVLPKNFEYLDWMIPAPSQGAILVCAMKNDDFSVKMCQQINDANTNICTQIERKFLQTLEGGCTAPIGALAKMKVNQIHFRGALLSVDGLQKIVVDEVVNLQKGIGEKFAKQILKNGGQEIMQDLKKEL